MSISKPFNGIENKLISALNETKTVASVSLESLSNKVDTYLDQKVGDTCHQIFTRTPAQKYS